MPDAGTPVAGETVVKDLRPWKTLESRELLVAAPWIKLSVQQVRLPDGQLVDDYHQIHLPDYSIIFAETVDGRVVVERQYKHGAGKVTLTLPGGSIIGDETPLETAKRELLEETGYSSEKWQPLGSYVTNGNYGCGRAHLFQACHARQVAEPDSGDLEEMEILLMERAELLAAVGSSNVVLLGTVTAIALATSPLFAGVGDKHHPTEDLAQPPDSESMKTKQLEQRD